MSVGHHVNWLADSVEEFIECWWNTDIREDGASDQARSSLRRRGSYSAVHRFLLDVVQRNVVTPEEWARLCNVRVRTPAEVRDDANDFWEWLFDGEPLPGGSGSRGPLGSPQA